MKNGILKKISAIVLGSAMALGIGVAASQVGKGAVKETKAVATYELYSGALTEGDYIIVYDNGAMNNTVSSNRLGVTSVTIVNNKITTTDTDIVWTLAANGDYWTIKNGSNYAIGNGTKNQANVSTTLDDKARWTASGSSTYDFVNKYNDAEGVNKTLRRNGTYGFACYSDKTGGALSLYKLQVNASVSLPATLEGYVGQAGLTLTGSASNYEPDTFVWESDATGVVEVSGSTATGALTLKTTGTANITLTASKGSVSASATCAVTVKEAPTAVNIKVGGEVVPADYVLEQYEGASRVPTTAVLPEGASQTLVLTVQSETTAGAFTVDGNRIYYNIADATGVIRFTSVKESVYFDLNVKCNADPFTPDTLTYTGDPINQSFGAAFDPQGLAFKVTKASGVKNIAYKDMTFTPATMSLDTTSVTAYHAESGQSVTVPVTVDEPLTVAQALAIINALEDGKTTTRGYTVIGLAYYAQDLSGKTYTSQDYRLSDDGTDSGQYGFTVYRGTWIDGADMSDTAGKYVVAGDKVIVTGKLQKFVKNETTTPEMIGNAPIVDITQRYVQIEAWIDANMHLDDYGDESAEKGYCNDATHHYYSTAKEELAKLGEVAIAEFASNQETASKFKAAYARYVAWAAANHDGAPFDGNSGIVTPGSNVSTLVKRKQDYATIILVAIAATSLVGLSTLLLLKKKKEQ